MDKGLLMFMQLNFEEVVWMQLPRHLSISG